MRPEHWLYTIPLRLRSLFRWAQADQELDDELHDHLERKTGVYVAQGMTQEEARRQARLDLGGIEQTKGLCSIRAESAWGNWRCSARARRRLVIEFRRTQRISCD